MAKSKKNAKNYKARMKDDLLKKISTCLTHAGGMRFIHQGIRNGIIDMSDSITLRKSLPPKPEVIIKHIAEVDTLFGVVVTPNSIEQIKLQKEGKSWAYKDISVKSTGVFELQDKKVIYVTDDKEHADIFYNGAMITDKMK